MISCGKLCACGKRLNFVCTSFGQQQRLHFITIASFFRSLFGHSFDILQWHLSRDLRIREFFSSTSCLVKWILFLFACARALASWASIVRHKEYMYVSYHESLGARGCWKHIIFKCHSIFHDSLSFCKCCDLGITSSSASPIIYCVDFFVSSMWYTMPIKDFFSIASRMALDTSVLVLFFFLFICTCGGWKCCRKCVSQPTEAYSRL